MITKPVTFSTFFVTYLKKDASLTSIYRITRDFSTCLALRSRMASYFLVTTLLFCLAFPTLAGSMTGYTAPTQAFVQKADNTKTPLGDVQYVLYTIHDGERINLTNNHIVAAISEDWSSTEPRGEVINMTRLSRNTQSPFDVSAMPIRSNSLLVQTSTCKCYPTHVHPSIIQPTCYYFFSFWRTEAEMLLVQMLRITGF